MMKFMLMIFMLIPLCILNKFWLVQFMFFLMSFYFMLNYSFNYIYINLSYNFSMDLISYMMILLSFWICSLMIMASMKIYSNNNWSELFLLVIVFLMLALYITFSSLNLFLFYLFFEISLIPTLILIIGWGYQPERLQAGVYLLFYTLLASLPMMISIFICLNKTNSLDFFFLKISLNEMLMYLCMNMVFFVKIPMFFIHLWLPKAHVEAPVSGSMILAGIMLKLGGYGLLRLMMMFEKFLFTLNMFFISLSLIGGLIISLICMRQSDIKSLIAYSSVSHMSLVLSGILTLNIWGFGGSLVMMIAHGLCSSGLFCLINISYERLMSRSFFLNKGLINIIPNMSLWWFLLVSSNMAAPPSLNLLGEIMLINSILSFNYMNMIFLSLISFFGAVYSLYLYSFSQHGMFYSGVYSFFSINMREYLVLMLHWIPLNLLILKSDMFIF